MSNDARWTISSSGPYMFVRFAVGTESPESYSTGALGFLAKIHYGKEILSVSMINLIKQCHSDKHIYLEAMSRAHQELRFNRVKIFKFGKFHFSYY